MHLGLVFILLKKYYALNSRWETTHRCSVRKGALRNFSKFTGKHLCQSLFFNKVADLAWKFKKETLAQLFSCEFCEISKDTSGDCFWPFADVFKIDVLKISKRLQQKTPTQVFSCDYCEIFTNSFFIEHFRWLLLHLILLYIFKL